MTKYFLLLAGLLVFSSEAALGQKLKSKFKTGHTKSRKLYGASNDKTKTFGFSVGTGIASYFGEMCETGDCFSESKAQLNLGVRYRFRSNMSVKGEVQWYRIGGRDRRMKNGKVVKTDRTGRNLSFRSDNYEVTTAFQFDLFPNTAFYESYSKRRPFNMYGIVGVGFTAFFPQAYYMDKTGNAEPQWYYLRGLQTEGKSYSVVAGILPVGLGARYKLSPTLDAAVEVAYRFTTTDYLDDVSSKHVSQASFEGKKNGAIAAALADRRPEVGQLPAAAGTIRGDNSTRDGYYLISAKLEYTMTEKGYKAAKKRQILRKYSRKVPRYR